MNGKFNVGLFFNGYWIQGAEWFGDAKANHARTCGDESGEEMKSYGNNDMEEHAELEWSAVGVARIDDDGLGKRDERDNQGGGESGLCSKISSP